MSGLIRNNDKTPEGEYLVKRRNGTQFTTPCIVLAASDPTAVPALQALAAAARTAGLDPEYVDDIEFMVEDWKIYQSYHNLSDPSAPVNITDDLTTVAEMRGHSMTFGIQPNELDETIGGFARSTEAVAVMRRYSPCTITFYYYDNFPSDINAVIVKGMALGWQFDDSGTNAPMQGA